MRKFLRGERPNGLVRLAFTLLLAISTISLWLTITSRIDAGNARASARSDRAAINQVTRALRTQCEQEVTRNQQLRALEQADVDLQRGLIAADKTNTAVSAQVRRTRLAVYERKLRQDLTFLTLPAFTPAVCAPFTLPLPIVAYSAAMPCRDVHVGPICV